MSSPKNISTKALIVRIFIGTFILCIGVGLVISHFLHNMVLHGIENHTDGHDVMLAFDQIAANLFVLFALILIYIVVSRKLIDPIMLFSQQLASKDEIHVASRIKEINTLEQAFNTRIKAYNQMVESSQKDPLTNLPHLMKLHRDLKAYEQESAILVINIDGFKSINNFYGYETGDALLVALKEKVLEVIEGQGTLYRVSGSEFALWFKEPIDFLEIVEFLEKINTAKYELDGVEVLISVTGGYAYERTKVFEKATAALNDAKEHHKPLESFHSKIDKKDEYDHNAYWTNIINDAIDHERIVTYYQPIFDTLLNQTRKYETLVRLIDREGNVHLPGVFLPVAKRSRHYLQITRIVMRRAFEYFKDKKGIEFTINISYDDILDDATRQYIVMLLERFEEPERVIFELLESEEVEHFSNVMEFIKEVKALGARIAIDDFGSGYSNFVYLTEIDADFIKIDSSLIKTMHYDERSRIIVKTIVSFAKELEIKTVAEYVADKEIFECVQKAGVDFLQGFYIGKPEEEILDVSER